MDSTSIVIIQCGMNCDDFSNVYTADDILRWLTNCKT